MRDRASLSLPHIQSVATRDPAAEDPNVKVFSYDKVIYRNDEMIQCLGDFHNDNSKTFLRFCHAVVLSSGFLHCQGGLSILLTCYADFDYVGGPIPLSRFFRSRYFLSSLRSF